MAGFGRKMLNSERTSHYLFDLFDSVWFVRNIYFSTVDCWFAFFSSSSFVRFRLISILLLFFLLFCDLRCFAHVFTLFVLSIYEYLCLFSSLTYHTFCTHNQRTSNTFDNSFSQPSIRTLKNDWVDLAESPKCISQQQWSEKKKKTRYEKRWITFRKPSNTHFPARANLNKYEHRISD